jgi:nucleoside-diphosphate-sugar epimerase
MNVLVTGATGFVGHHLVHELIRRGFRVRCIVHRRPFCIKQLEKVVELVTGDVTDVSCVRKVVKDVDIVFHLAALLGRWQSEYSDYEYYRVNFIGTKLLIEQCLKAGVNHFVYLSSTGVIGRVKETPADESYPCGPIFPYERSKYLAELEVRNAVEKSSFPATIVRAAHIYGPGDINTLKILKVIKRLKLFPLIDGGRAIFQPIYVKDLVKALVLCVEKRNISIGKTYIIAGNERVSFKDFIRLSAELLKIQLLCFSIPRPLANFIGLACEATFPFFHREPPLTCSRVEFFSRNQIYCINKICEELSFRPRISLRSGLQETINWYMKRGLL